ncbi:MAG: alpha/beta hydrolase, partial [Bacteroidota bacterium]
MYPILLLHGALGAASLLRPLSQTWSTDYQVLTPDFPGHGSLAGHKESMTIKSLSDFLIQWMDEQGLSKVAVFGYSMGGYIALVSAFHRPNLFACIATLGTKFDWSPEIATQEMRKLNPEKILTKVPKFATMLTQRHGAANWQKVVNQTAHLMQDLGETPILTEDTLGQIQTPTHILLGD